MVRRFDRENLTGFVNPLSYLQPHNLELLTPEGSLVLLPYEDVKSVCFVKDFEAEALLSLDAICARLRASSSR